MIKRLLFFLCWPRTLPLLTTLAALVTLVLPSESFALVRQNPASGSLFVSEWETCRNDPVNNSDPLGLAVLVTEAATFCGIELPAGHREYMYGTTVPENMIATIANIGPLLANSFLGLAESEANRQLCDLQTSLGPQGFVSTAPVSVPLTIGAKGLFALGALDRILVKEPAVVRLLTEVTSGAALVARPGKTTTILGRWSSDMQYVVRELMGIEKSWDFGAKPGGFNVLNVPSGVGRWGQGKFWELFNEPFLKAAINRGDDIILATVPTSKSQIMSLTSGELSGMFARELQYLVEHNYRPSNVTTAQWATIRSWFGR